ncbi:unnamed protein product [Gongylonema pulchrum]|uniref:DH domain-containing protein n=1 Tax=Gongylonema pulchrum TaxID=637853 RepID=A0A183D1C3_9BILA|nr:unnamed protein product [Gongylonema pulchrum]
MKLFVGLPSQCTRFIETALQDKTNDPKLRSVLLELRLRQWALHNELCQMFNFVPGIVDIFTKMKRYDKLIEYHMQQNKLLEIIDLCEKQGFVFFFLYLHKLYIHC